MKYRLEYWDRLPNHHGLHEVRRRPLVVARSGRRPARLDPSDRSKCGCSRRRERSLTATRRRRLPPEARLRFQKGCTQRMFRHHRRDVSSKTESVRHSQLFRLPAQVWRECRRPRVSTARYHPQERTLRGPHRTDIQRLSRLNDERGTYRVYDILSNSGVDVHLYGIGDADPTDDLPVTVHTGTSYPYRRSWFVVFRPPTDAEISDPAALLALEDEPNVWDGFWTFRQPLVKEIETYIADNI